MKKAYLFVLGALISAITFAQEKSAEINVDINKGGSGGGNWYASPILWIVGVAVFVLLLIALTNGGGSSRRSSGTTDKVTVKKTVQTDTDAG